MLWQNQFYSICPWTSVAVREIRDQIRSRICSRSVFHRPRWPTAGFRFRSLRNHEGGREIFGPTGCGSSDRSWDCSSWSDSPRDHSGSHCRKTFLAANVGTEIGTNGKSLRHNLRPLLHALTTSFRQSLSLDEKCLVIMHQKLAIIAIINYSKLRTLRIDI